MDLRLSNASLRVGGHLALDTISLELPAGSQVLLLGSAASGKTSLLKVLAGLRKPTSGEVFWDSERLDTLSQEQRRSRQASFGMVFQTDALFDSMTALNNVALPLRNRGLSHSEAHARALAALKEVGLESAANVFPERLSGGMKKRVGLARALVAEPRILLADDPLAGLDPHTAQALAKRFQQVSQGKTWVASLPDPLPWFPAPRWLVLDAGRLVYDGPPAPERLALPARDGLFA